MTRRNKRIVGTVGLVFMSIIATAIGVAIAAALTVGVVHLSGS